MKEERLRDSSREMSSGKLVSIASRVRREDSSKSERRVGGDITQSGERERDASVWCGRECE